VNAGRGAGHRQADQRQAAELAGSDGRCDCCGAGQGLGQALIVDVIKEIAKAAVVPK
jgi:hypothetical protein